jgi:hypothetical protein
MALSFSTPILRRAAVVAAVACVAAPAALAATSSRDAYIRHHLSSYAPVAGLDGFRTGVTAGALTPAGWKTVRSTPKGTLVLEDRSHTNCTFRVTFTARLVLGAKTSAEQYVTDQLPAAGSPYVLDTGVRGQSAWRVIRRKTAATDPRIRLKALRATPSSLTPATAAPAGQRLWREVTATAVSGARDECHSGTYRQGAGPQIGDALATSSGRGYAFKPRR